MPGGFLMYSTHPPRVTQSVCIVESLGTRTFRVNHFPPSQHVKPNVAPAHGHPQCFEHCSLRDGKQGASAYEMALQCIGSLPLGTTRVTNAFPGPLAIVPPRAPRPAAVRSGLQQRRLSGDQCMSILPVRRAPLDRSAVPVNMTTFYTACWDAKTDVTAHRAQRCKAASSEAAGLVPEQRSDWEKFTETLTTLFPVWVMTHAAELLN